MLPNLVLMLKSSYSLNCVYPILLYHTSHVIFGFREIPNSTLDAVWKYLISGEWQWTIWLNLCLISSPNVVACRNYLVCISARNSEPLVMILDYCMCKNIIKVPTIIYVVQSAKCLYDFTTPNLNFLLLNAEYNCLMF